MKNAIPLWDTWKNKYAWSFITYFIGAASAGILHLLTDSIGFGVIIASFPVIFFVFLTYRMYLKNIEISMQQAEQAEQYAKILEDQSVALGESEERFRSAFNHAPIGIALVSSGGNLAKGQSRIVQDPGILRRRIFGDGLSVDHISGRPWRYAGQNT